MDGRRRHGQLLFYPLIINSPLLTPRRKIYVTTDERTGKLSLTYHHYSFFHGPQHVYSSPDFLLEDLRPWLLEKNSDFPGCNSTAKVKLLKNIFGNRYLIERVPKIWVYHRNLKTFFLFPLRNISLSVFRSVIWCSRIRRLHLSCWLRTPPSDDCPVYDIKQSDGEAPVMLELCRMRNSSSLPSFPGPRWSGVVALIEVQSKGQIEPFTILTDRKQDLC